MPLPFLAIPLIIKGAAVVAGAIGAGAAVKGAVDAKNANDTMKAAKERNEDNISKFEESEKNANSNMERLGRNQATVAKDFERFSNAFEKIKNKPDFSMRKLSADITEFDFDQIKTSSVAGGAILGGAAGGAAGAALGTAAAIGLQAAVMAIGTASTGTAISGLAGAAATKATLAWLGGGALAAGGGGVAAGAAALGAATLGIGFLVGGAIFAVTGSKIKGKADEAYDAMLDNEDEINRCIKYFTAISGAANRLNSAINKVHKVYDAQVKKLIDLVNRETDWNSFNDNERRLVENNILLVSVLHKMINTPLLTIAETDKDGNPTKTDIDNNAINNVIESSTAAIENI